MQQHGRGISWALTLLGVLLQLSCTQEFSIRGSRMTRSNNEIDNFIYSLTYSNNHVLSYKGDSKTSVVKKEGIVDGKRDFVVISRERKSVFNRKSDIEVVASNEHRTFPGSLLLFNQRLVDNSPDLLVVNRAPLTYTVNLPGLTTDSSFKVVPSFSEYKSGINKALNTWFVKHSEDHNIPTNFLYDLSLAYSKEFLRVKFGLELKNTKIESNIDFSGMNKQEKLIAIHRFKQIFYTVSIKPTNKPSDLFGSNVTVEEVKGKVNNNNPPVIIDSVSYGRTIYIIIETSSTDQEAKLLLQKNLQELKNRNQVEISRKLQNLNMQVYILGGASEQIELINARTIKEVNNVIIKYSKFSRQNQGLPISYSSQFIKDNSRAVVNMATDYIETSRTVHPKGTVKLVHKGGFIMRWNVKWSELNYDANGNPTETKQSWDKNDHDLTAPFEQEIELPGNAQDIYVFAKEATGLFWEWWRTVIDKSGIPLIDKRTFYVWGTTLNPQYEISPPV